jgi:Fe-S cluster assembly protein SufD
MKLADIVLDEAQNKNATIVKSYENFRAIGIPTKKLEGWKYIDLSQILSTDFDLKPEINLKETQKDAWQEKIILEGNSLVFLNGQFNPSVSHLEGIKKPVVLEVLKGAIPKNVENEHIFSNRHENNFFSLINDFQFNQAVYLHIPDGLQFEKPIQIIFATTGAFKSEKAFFPRIFLSLGKNAKAQASLQFVGFSESAYLEDSVIDVLLNERSQLDLNWLTWEGVKASRFSKMRVTLHRESRLNLFHFTQGGAVTRNEVEVHADEPAVQCHINGLSCLSGQSQVYSHLSVNHHSTEGVSRQVQKNILTQKTKSEFNSLVYVERGAQKSDTYQLNKNLLLSDDAQAITRPQLKIYADDVKCHHGATVGHLEDVEIFYLLSRGLSREEARSLLIFGFADEMLQEVKDKVTRQFLNTIVHRELEDFVEEVKG